MSYVRKYLELVSQTDFSRSKLLIPVQPLHRKPRRLKETTETPFLQLLKSSEFFSKNDKEAQTYQIIFT